MLTILCLVSCTIDVPQDAEIIQSEIIAEPRVAIETTEESKENEVEKIILKPMPEYPAYILDQCDTLWGIPATLQGETQKVKIDVQQDDGTIIPMSELDFFTLDGAIYLVHKYTTTSSDNTAAEAIDYYKQEAGVIAQVDTIPDKPSSGRVTFSGSRWTIETSIINGVEVSYLYNLDPDMIAEQGNAGGKGARMGAWGMITGAVELDKGILIMTNDGALFYPVNRACGNPVSEKGRLWK